MIYSGLRSAPVITQPFPTGDRRLKLSRRHSFKYSTDKLPFSDAMIVHQGLAAIFQLINFSWKRACTSNHLYQHLLIYCHINDKQTSLLLPHKPPAKLDLESYQTIKSPSSHRDYFSAWSMMSSFQSRKNCWQSHEQL